MKSRSRKVHGAKALLGNPDKWRARIEVSKLVNQLQMHVIGDVELSASQVSAANILLKKVLPDQTENKTEHSGEVTVVGTRYTDPNT